MFIVSSIVIIANSFCYLKKNYIKTIIIELRIREINILDPYREIVGHLVRVVLVVGVVLLREVVNLKTNIIEDDL